MPGAAPPSGPIGILAGGGGLPREIADEIVATGRAVHVVAIAGEADRDFAPHPVTPVDWGQIGRMVRTLREAGARELVIVGRVRRPDLRRVKPDLGLLANLPGIARIVLSGGDDSVLRKVIRFFEGQGFRVVGPAEVAPGLVVGEGPLGAVRAPPAAEGDMAFGRRAVGLLGGFDIGQGVVVRGGHLVAIEGAEGTDAMLERVAGMCSGAGGVLVKRPKPGQELRVDLPVIGPQTVAGAERAGLAGITVEAGRTLAADRVRLVREADAAGLFVTGHKEEGAAGLGIRPPPPDVTLALLGRLQPGEQGTADAAAGVRVLETLRTLQPSSGVVVARGHVLAVEAGEGLEAMLQRAGGLRQWGLGAGRRRGVVALGRPIEEGRCQASAAAVAAAGLSGIAAHSADVPRTLIAAATEAGLFIVGAKVG
jgi:DUF1009 family protein